MTDNLFVKRLFWGFSALLMLALLSDYLMHQGGDLARGAFFGLFLGFVIQLAFYWLSHRSGRRASGGQMFSDMTLAMVGKWCLALVGFGLVFRFGSDFSIPLVFVGFFLMQPVAFVAYLKKA